MCEPLPSAGEWGRKPGLNRQLAAYKAAALPLSYRGIKTARRGMAVWLKGKGEDKMPEPGGCPFPFGVPWYYYLTEKV